MRRPSTALLLRPRIGLDDAIGGALLVAAIVLMALIGVHEARRPVYGPIDEITHTAYVMAVAKDGVPPFLGRDRAFAGHRPLAPRDVLIPAPDKVGSAPVPIGSFGEVTQAEAFQPPMYYYAAAPVTWFVSGRDTIVALRLFDVFLCLIAVVLAFVAVRDIAGSALGGGVAALLLTSAGGIIGILSFVTNGSIMLTLGAAALWLSMRGIRARRLSWPLALVASGLAITQVIVVPLAIVCLLAPAIAQLREHGRAARRDVGRRVLFAAAPLALWIVSNLYRYHWIVPKARSAHGAIGGLAETATTVNLNTRAFGDDLYHSFITTAQDSFGWWGGPYDFRPLALFLPLTLIGIGVVLLRGTELQRTAVAYWLIGLAAAHLAVFAMLYLAVVVTGGGDFVYRYFSAAEFAAACLAGACFGSLFRNATLQRALTVVVGVALAYWTYNSSPL